MKTVLGIDPGNYKTGFSVLLKENNSLKILKAGVIKPVRKKPLHLKQIFSELEKVIKEFNPEEIALESSFFGKNPQTLIRLGEIRGIILLLSALYDIPIYEYTPQQVKNAITGYGWAKKEDVLSMVERFLNFKPESFDEADAIAIAFCHLLNS
ncbi:MAG: crossover junction endodeoxyribonuclease RuvC [Persephonella sp.]|nr:MAG: crossover junction endodeoxyribonuclease RuvC [Persephonella sp.]RUM60976.1 MAG: crossover junction endodeoxyribonuclease RuvC [Persephonella sp.]